MGLIRRKKEPDAEAEGAPAAPPASINPSVANAWIARGSIMLNVILGCVIYGQQNYIGLTRTDYKVLPIPFAIHNRGEVAYQILPFGETIAGETAFATDRAAKYVDFRYGVLDDLEEMERRWNIGGFMHCRSTDDVWRRFSADVDGIIEAARRAGHYREARNVRLIETEKGYRKLAFDLVTYTLPGGPKGDKKDLSLIPMVATLTYQWQAQTANRPDATGLCNPEGFVVTSFVPAKRTN